MFTADAHTATVTLTDAEPCLAEAVATGKSVYLPLLTPSPGSDLSPIWAAAAQGGAGPSVVSELELWESCALVKQGRDAVSFAGRVSAVAVQGIVPPSGALAFGQRDLVLLHVARLLCGGTALPASLSRAGHRRLGNPSSSGGAAAAAGSASSVHSPLVAEDNNPFASSTSVAVSAGSAFDSSDDGSDAGDPIGYDAALGGTPGGPAVEPHQAAVSSLLAMPDGMVITSLIASGSVASETVTVYGESATVTVDLTTRQVIVVSPLERTLSRALSVPTLGDTPGQAALVSRALCGEAGWDTGGGSRRSRRQPAHHPLVTMQIAAKLEEAFASGTSLCLGGWWETWGLA